MRLLVFSIFAIFACITVSWAAPGALPGKVEYHFTFGNLRFGELTLQAKEAAGQYELATTAKTSGLVRVFSKHQSNSKAEGKASAGTLAPERYETKYASKGKTKHIILQYDSAGNITDTWLHEDKRKEEEKVTAEQKRGGLDPISALLHVRQQLAAAKSTGAKNFTFLLYDGTRLSKITVDILPAEAGGNIHITLRRKPVAGWKAKDLQKFNAKPEPLLHAYFSDDAEMIPLSVSLTLDIGTLKGFLVKKG